MEQGALALSLLCALAVHAQNAEARTFALSSLGSSVGRFATAVFAAWAVTIPFSVNFMGSLQIGGRTGLFLLGVVLLWAVVKAHRAVQPLMLRFVVAASVFSAVLALASLSGVPYVLSALRANFHSPELPVLGFKAFAAAGMCLIPVVVWAGRRLGGTWRFLGYAFAPLAIAIILLTENRSALAGLLAVVVIAAMAFTIAKHRFAGLLGILGISVVAGIIAWVHHIRYSITFANATGPFAPNWLVDPHRQFIWKFAFDKFLESPWVGIGIDQLNRLPGAHETVPGLGDSAHIVPSHPHSWVLEILAETGLIGFLPVLAGLTALAWEALKRYVRLADEGALAQLVLIAGFWGSALFNFSIWSVWWQLTFFVLYAMIAATSYRESAPS